MASKHLSDGVEGIFGNGIEYGGIGQIPELSGFFQELPCEIFGPDDKKDVGSGGTENCVVLLGWLWLVCGSEKWLAVFSGNLH